MESATLEGLIDKIKEYIPDELDKVIKAYHLASNLHKGQYRQSGEPYIIHPLTVAYILAEMHMDSDTICAGLLHDTLEDTNITKQEIAELFNNDISNLVDGVTKISKMNYSTKEEANMANTRKIITSIVQDIRIIIIKLADRLHNMRTLQYKSEYKQKENAIETMEIYVPIAYLIGAYRIKSELEDLSFKYGQPDTYKKFQDKAIKIKEESEYCVKEALYKINNILTSREIPNEVKVRTKNIYGIYKRHLAGHNMNSIHDLITFKIMVDEIDRCYLLLRPIHELYKPVNNKFKDYIANPKTNKYQSLHTTVFGPDNRLVQMQIRTFDMDKIASFGLTAYWEINKGQAREKVQEELKNKYRFYKSLLEIDKVFTDNREFVTQVKNEILSNKIYVYTSTGEIIDLPIGATAIDFAYEIDESLGNKIGSIYINDELAKPEYILKNKDRVHIITGKSEGPKLEWLDVVSTTKAKQLIRKYYKTTSHNI